MVYLDANVFVFAALATDELGEASRRILAALDGINAKTCSLTFDELAWAALRKVDMMTTVKVCRAILGVKGLDIVSVDFGDVWKMTENMERFGLKPRDAIHLAVMQRLGERIIVSENGHFDTAEVKRIPIMDFASSI
ncbi:type II toxin-antitoxin system VapC family toxin [Candidatus Bathyarchaeota archaeon]|nr:type II toxin-antitoxin system VapC family toxin [Candidatus Bathyarchaeota archaeon]